MAVVGSEGTTVHWTGIFRRRAEQITPILRASIHSMADRRKLAPLTRIYRLLRPVGELVAGI